MSMENPEITCEGCGACCMSVGWPPFDRDEEIESLPPAVRADFRIGVKDTPCTWLDEETRQCRHYEYRPDVCRDYEMGEFDCQLARSQYQDIIDIT